MAAAKFKVGDPVIHRAWNTKGVVTKTPRKMTGLSRLHVQWDNGQLENTWVPAIMHDFDEMLFDWGDEDGQEGKLLDTDEW